MMGKSGRNRRRKDQRAYKARQAAFVAERTVAAADRAVVANDPCPITDISALNVSVHDVEAAGTASEAFMWYVGRCEPMAEQKALRGLRERRIAAYVPTERRWRWLQGHKRLVERPLFPGYIFLGLSARQSIYDATRVSGVESVVESFGQPALIDGWALVQIAAAELAGAFDHTGPKRQIYSRDQKVMVVAGQFAGFIAKVVEAKGDRLRILFEAGLFKGSPFPVDEGQVTAVDERAAA
jgi:transcriptional antiterminator RfaH